MLPDDLFVKFLNLCSELIALPNCFIPLLLCAELLLPLFGEFRFESANGRVMNCICPVESF